MSKGSKFERDLCRQLTSWWTGDPAADVVFWRTAGSGGRATTRRKKDQDTTAAHCGDLGALNDDAAILTRFVTFESKRGYQTATLTELLDGRDSKASRELVSFFAQALESSRNARTPHWAVIHRRNGRQALLYADWGFFKFCSDAYTTNWPQYSMVARFDVDDLGDDGVVGVCRFGAFLAAVSAKLLRQRIKWHFDSR